MNKIYFSTAWIPGIIFCLVSFFSFSQNIGISGSGSPPNSSAALDINFTSKGLLIPRVTNCQRTTPSCAGGLLDPSGNLPAAAQGLVVYQTDGVEGFYYNTSTTVTPVWSYLSSSSTGAWSLTGNTGTSPGINFLGTADANALILKTSNTERLRILSIGNIGIGTATPVTELEVRGAVQTQYLRLEAASSLTFDANLYMEQGSSAPLSIGNSGRIIYNADALSNLNQRFRVSADGSAYKNLAVEASALPLTSGSIPFANAAGELDQKNVNLFWDNTNTRLGIGTNSPSALLHINNGHVRSQQTTAPTIVVTTQNGITAAAITAGSSDTKGTITTTGINGGGNTVLTITFNAAYSASPTVVITPAKTTAQGCTYFVTSSATTFVLNFAAGGADPSFNYIIIE